MADATAETDGAVILKAAQAPARFPAAAGAGIFGTCFYCKLPIFVDEAVIRRGGFTAHWNQRTCDERKEAGHS